MDLDSFNFVLNNTVLGPTSTYTAGFNFISGNDPHLIPPTTGGQTDFSGIIFGPTGSIPLTETGYFDGSTYIKVESASGLSAPSWTMFFLFDKDDNQENVLFSNYQGEANKSGWVIGVNSSNSLYAESYGVDGPLIYQSDIRMSSRNAVAVSKNINTLTFDYFDFNTKQNESNFFFTSTGTFFNSEEWYLGSPVNTPSHFSGNNFQGHLDTFIYLTGTYFPYQVNQLFNALTLARTPEYSYTVIDEQCFYDYSGLTGNFSSISFDVIDDISYLVQTGYLVNKTGQLLAVTTGHIETGLCTASGSITGIVNSGSGFYNVTYSGFTGIFTETMYQGLRIFENEIPTGISGAYFTFPSDFSGTPVIFTELNSPNNVFFVEHQITGLSTSGFFLQLSEMISGSGWSLTTFAGPPQDNPDFKLQKVDLPSNINFEYIEFPSLFTSTPKVYCGLENNVEPILLEQYISDVSTSGFALHLSDLTNYNLCNVTNDNYKLNYLATTFTRSDGIEIETTTLTSGTSGQFITFSASFPSTPLSFGQLVNISGEELYAHTISGNTAGLNVSFSDNLSSSNYRFNSMSWSGAQNQSTLVTGIISGLIYISQATDEAENVYNLSGFGVATEVTSYDVVTTHDVLRSGVNTIIDSGVDIIPIDINVSINYSIPVRTGQLADFVHTTFFENPGFNFLTVNHNLYYSNLDIQPDPFIIYKNCNQLMGSQLEPYTYDTNYVYSFGMDGVAYIEKEGALDYSNLTIFPYSDNKLNINKFAFVDRLNNTYILDGEYSPTTINIYENGIGLFGSGYYTSGNRNIPSGDIAFFTTNGIPANVPDDSDQATYDSIAGCRDYFRIPNRLVLVSGYYYLPFVDVSSKDLYLNGVKLSSGIDYIGERAFNADMAKLINMDLAYTTGKAFSMPLDLDTNIKYSGNFNSIFTQKFARGTSMLWANGVRERLNDEYVEIGRTCLLTGTRNFINGENIINDNEDFWE